MLNQCATVEMLEQRRLLSVSFSNGDLNGTWALNQMNSAGSVDLDGAGNLTGGNITDDSDQTETPTGTYSISSGGAVTISAEDNFTGAMNASKNLVAFGNGQQNNLGILTNSGSASFSSGDLSGTWYEFNNGDPSIQSNASSGNSGTDTAGNTGHGSINFNAASGTFSGSNTNDDSGHTDTVTGNYSVSAGGSVSFALANENLQAIGTENADKNVVVLSPTDLAAAASDNDSRLLVFISPSGKYSKASLDGTWTAVFDKGQATLNFNGAGKVSGTMLGGGSLSGKYTVASNGTFGVTFAPSSGTDNKTTTFAGAINGSHDVAAMTQPKSGHDDNMIVMVSSEPTEHAPTLTKIATLKTATAGQPFTISYAALLAASNAADIDGDPIIFKIEAIGIGTFLLDGSRPVLGADFTSSDLITWTPTATTKGNFAAFSVKAFDGTDVSIKSVAVKVAIAKA